MVKGGCYVRVSTDNQLENYSIEEQKERLQSFCKAKDIIIVKFYTDGGFSGGSINRPALQQMLADIESGIINTVVVYKLDRLSRSQKDTLMLIEDKFMANHVDFISVNENFDTSTAFGRAMVGILSVFAQLEKEQITERFTMGRIGRAKNGLYHGGASAPTGYDYIDGKLVVNEYEALQVRELYERFRNGYPLHNCWQYMRDKYMTKYGAWTSETLVRSVLKNDVYIGMVKFKGQSYKGIHEPIISVELYNAVQDIFAHSKRGATSNGRSPYKASTLLSGLLYCGKCGARFHGEHGNYSCYSRTKGDKKYILDPDCKNMKWKIPELDAHVIHHISQFSFEEIPVRTISSSNSHASINYTGKMIKIDRQINSLINLYQTGNIPLETISEKIELLTKEKNIFQENMEKSAARNAAQNEPIPFPHRFDYFLQNGNLQEKRACLTHVIKRIVLDDERIDIILK